MRDKEDPTHFISVGEWPDEQVIEEWRGSEGFKERLGNIRQLLDDMSVRAFDLAGEAGPVSAWQ